MSGGHWLNISDEEYKSILAALGTTEESFNQDVENVKEWMKSQPHLPEILDDQYIRNFLVLNKRSIEVTKQKIDMYYTVKTLIPEVYEQINPKSSNVKELMDIIYCIPLPKLTEEMYRVIIFKIRDPTMVDKMEPINFMRYCINVQEIRLKEDIMYGDIIIQDWEGVHMGFMTKLTPTTIARFFLIYEKVYSIRMKALIYVNVPPVFSKLLAVLKRLLKQKLFDRIYACQDTSILKERIPTEILPKDYGGEGKSLEELQELQKKNFKDNEKRFDKLDQMRVNENLRLRKLKNDEIMGFHGYFKKLEFD